MAGKDFPATGGAFVAGGSGGIGRAIALKLADAGVGVAFTYFRNAGAGEKLAAELKAKGATALALQLDLRDAAAVQAAVTRAEAEFGGLHTVVYAAGPYITFRHISRITPEMFRDQIEHDTIGCFNLIAASLPALRKVRGSLLATVTPAIDHYAKRDVLSSAPKAAIENVVKGVAAEEGRFGVRANCIGVGLLEDGMYHALLAKGDFTPEILSRMTASMALGCMGRAEDIAEAALFLASSRARWITGQTLHVDGGYAI
jgi:NAD(P)-dependent dehydrogenase (short-subunit alcohol dehydrogenase family)